ncbi:hypothetical protein D3C80_611230 [compost metagenome]
MPEQYRRVLRLSYDQSGFDHLGLYLHFSWTASLPAIQMYLMGYAPNIHLNR